MGATSQSLTDADLGDHVVLIHEGGWELFEVDKPDAEEVEQFADSLPGEEPDVAAFNADAHPDHSSVDLVDSMHADLAVEETLREMREEVLA